MRSTSTRAAQCVAGVLGVLVVVPLLLLLWLVVLASSTSGTAATVVRAAGSSSSRQRPRAAQHQPVVARSWAVAPLAGGAVAGVSYSKVPYLLLLLLLNNIN